MSDGGFFKSGLLLLSIVWCNMKQTQHRVECFIVTKSNHPFQMTDSKQVSPLSTHVASSGAVSKNILGCTGKCNISPLLKKRQFYRDRERQKSLRTCKEAVPLVSRDIDPQKRITATNTPRRKQMYCHSLLVCHLSITVMQQVQ